MVGPGLTGGGDAGAPCREPGPRPRRARRAGGPRAGIACGGGALTRVIGIPGRAAAGPTRLGLWCAGDGSMPEVGRCEWVALVGRAPSDEAPVEVQVQVRRLRGRRERLRGYP